MIYYRCIVMILLLMCIAMWDAPNVDERSHLACGIYDWKTGGHDLYYVNPPLVRAIASFPASWSVSLDSEAIDIARSSSFSNWGGALADSLWNRDPIEMDRWVIIGRLTLIPLVCLGLFSTEILCKRYYGGFSADIAGWLYVFTPAMLAAGRSISSDAVCASLIVTSIAIFQAWLDKPSWSKSLLLGWIVGLSMLTKTVAIFSPLWFLPCFFLWHFAKPHPVGMSWRHLKLHGSQLTISFLIALSLVNFAYGFKGSFKPIGDFLFISRSFSGNTERKTADDISSRGSSRFRGSLIGHLRVPLPEFYVLGIDRQKLDFENGRQFFDGTAFRNGRWYDQLWAFVIKTPCGFLLLFLCAVTWTIRLRMIGVKLCEPHCVWSAFVFLLILNLSQTGMTCYYRYLVPCFPLMFILSSRLGVMLKADECYKISELRRGYNCWRFAGVFVLIVAGITSTSLSFPFFCRYLNEIVGGPWNGVKYYFTDSDLQCDQFRLRKWLHTYSGASPVYISDEYFSQMHRDFSFVRRLPAPRSNEGRKGIFIVGPFDVLSPNGRAGFLRDSKAAYFISPYLTIYHL